MRSDGLGGIARIGSALVMLFLTEGCATVTHLKQVAFCSFRRPGERMNETPEAAAKRVECVPTETRLVLEKVEVCPERIAVGSRVKHRVRYVLCPANGALSVRAKVTRTLIANDEVVLTHAVDQNLLAGTWTIDVDQLIPAEAPYGIYTFLILMEFQDQKVQASSRFYVQSR